MNRSKRDESWLLYMARETFIFVKYIGHKKKGTTLDVMIPYKGNALYIPFIIDNKPVYIESIIYPIK